MRGAPGPGGRKHLPFGMVRLTKAYRVLQGSLILGRLVERSTLETRSEAYVVHV